MLETHGAHLDKIYDAMLALNTEYNNLDEAAAKKLECLACIRVWMHALVLKLCSAHFLHKVPDQDADYAGPATATRLQHHTCRWSDS